MNLIVEKVFQRLLVESNKRTVDGLAVFLHRQKPTAVLYDPTDLIENFEKILDPDQRPMFFEDYGVADIIKGVVSVWKPSGPCRGAWKIDYIVGEGYGHILYPIAHELSPTGLLIPDRPSGEQRNVTDQAATAWKKSIDKYGRVGLPLDDIDAHKSNPMRDHPHHTPDPSDDCKVHTEPGLEYLNYAYPPVDGVGPMLGALVANHKSAMSQLPQDVVTEIEDILWEEADMFVDNNLPPGDL